MSRRPKRYMGHRSVPLIDAVEMRQRYNQLVELTPQRAVELYQAHREGRFASVQLCWDALEEYDDMLGTLVDRRQTALEDMSGNIKISSGITEGRKDLQNLANEQQQYLSAEFDRISNIKEAITAMSLATFRGYAHIEIVDHGEHVEFLSSDQWFWARPIRRGPWYYNPTANPTHGDLYEVDYRDIIVISVPRPVDIVGMFAITVKSHGEAGWDGFIDVFGNPALFFEYPPGTSDDKAREYDEIMDAVLGDGRGGYPSGGKIHPVETSAQGGDTFMQRCDWINKKMIYRGTGGLLTVLAESGTGTLAGSAHMEAFKLLAKGEAAKISECINRQYSDRKLEEKFPGQPKLAYWELASKDSTDVGTMSQTIQTLAAAGYRARDEQVSELTGINVKTEILPMPAMPGANPALLTNRQLMLPAPTPEKYEEKPLSPEELSVLKAALTWRPVTPESPVVTETEKLLKKAVKTGVQEKGGDGSQFPGKAVDRPSQMAGKAKTKDKEESI